MSTKTSSAKGSSGSLSESLGTLYERRWLIGYFVQRQMSIRYRGSFLGFGWLFLGPLLMVILYTLVFSEIIGLRFGRTDSVVNFGLYLYCGLLPFQAFADTLNQSAISIKRNESLVKRVVFPLEILPLSAAATAFFTQLFGLGVLVVLVVILSHQLQWTLILLPIIAVPQLLFNLGLGYLAAIGGTYVPDLQSLLQALVRALFFATPLMWPPELVPDNLRFIVDYNPLAYLVEAYRDLVLNGELPDTTELLWFSLFASVLMVAGFGLFVRVKRRFADLI